MKKLMWVFFALTFVFMLAAPALAADSEGPHYDLLDLDGEAQEKQPAAVYHDQSSDAPADGAESTPTPIVDVPVDESTYREEPSTPYVPPQRFPGRGKIDDILSHWEENGYPDDVSFAFEAGGEVTEDGTILSYWEIGLVDADEGRRQAILELVSPACLVEFQKCLFTHAQKQAAYDTITELAVDDPNILEVIFIRNGDTVWVSVPEEKTKEYAEYLIRDLGLGAVVSVTDQHSIASFEDATAPRIDIPGGLTTGPIGGGADGIQSAPVETGLVRTTPQAQTSPIFWVCLALAIFAACALTVLALRRRSVPAAVAEDGSLHAYRPPLTRREAERLVRESHEAPPSSLRQELLRRVEDDGDSC